MSLPTFPTTHNSVRDRPRAPWSALSPPAQLRLQRSPLGPILFPLLTAALRSCPVRRARLAARSSAQTRRARHRAQVRFTTAIMSGKRIGRVLSSGHPLEICGSTLSQKPSPPDFKGSFRSGKKIPSSSFCGRDLRSEPEPGSVERHCLRADVCAVRVCRDARLASVRRRSGS